MLTNPVHTVGELNEQLASREEYRVNKELMKAINKLYYDQQLDAPKKGAASKASRKGSCRRLDDWKNQITLTYDLFAMDSQSILNLLPSEFDEFKSEIT